MKSTKNISKLFLTSFYLSSLFPQFVISTLIVFAMNTEYSFNTKIVITVLATLSVVSFLSLLHVKYALANLHNFSSAANGMTDYRATLSNQYFSNIDAAVFMFTLPVLIAVATVNEPVIFLIALLFAQIAMCICYARSSQLIPNASLRLIHCNIYCVQSSDNLNTKYVIASDKRNYAEKSVHLIVASFRNPNSLFAIIK